MIAGMFRSVLLAVAIASCGKSAGNQEMPAIPPPPPGPMEIAPTPTSPPPDDPRLHLKPDEGTLTIDKAEGPAGAEASAGVKITPGTGFHMSTDYPITLTLE